MKYRPNLITISAYGIFILLIITVFVLNPSIKFNPRFLNSPQTNSSKCYLSPETGPCKAAINKYYYNQSSQTCESFIYGGCQGVVPFETLDECKNSCRSINESVNAIKCKPNENLKQCKRGPCCCPIGAICD